LFTSSSPSSMAARTSSKENSKLPSTS
jgi:hypothetical protein